MLLTRLNKCAAHVLSLLLARSAILRAPFFTVLRACDRAKKLRAILKSLLMRKNYSPECLYSDEKEEFKNRRN
jgi:hypothetical protein